MIRSKSFVLILTFIFCAFHQSSATVDYLAVNKITKEIYSFDQEQVPGILWVTVRDGAKEHYFGLGIHLY